MGKKKGEESSAPNLKTKDSKSAMPGKEKFSVSAMLASMDQKPEKPKSKHSSSKAKAKPTSYMGDLDLPPSDSEEDEVEGPEIDEPVRRATRATAKPMDGFAPSSKELKKRERNDMIEAHKLEQSKREALRDDRDAFGVVVGSKTSVLDGEVGAGADVQDNLSLPRARRFKKHKREDIAWEKVWPGRTQWEGKINLVVEVACMAQNPVAHEHRRGFGGAGSGWG